MSWRGHLEELRIDDKHVEAATVGALWKKVFVLLCWSIFLIKLHA